MECRVGNYRIRVAKEYPITNTMPRIYNAEGRLLETYFIKNRHSQHAPFGQEGKYFFWDRYNYGLDTHFYGAEEMTQTLGKPIVKYGMLTESRVIVPKDYEVFQKHRGLEKGIWEHAGFRSFSIPTALCFSRIQIQSTQER